MLESLKHLSIDISVCLQFIKKYYKLIVEIKKTIRKWKILWIKNSLKNLCGKSVNFLPIFNLKNWNVKFSSFIHSEENHYWIFLSWWKKGNSNESCFLLIIPISPPSFSVKSFFLHDFCSHWIEQKKLTKYKNKIQFELILVTRWHYFSNVVNLI